MYGGPYGRGDPGRGPGFPYGSPQPFQPFQQVVPGRGMPPWAGWNPMPHQQQQYSAPPGMPHHHQQQYTSPAGMPPMQPMGGYPNSGVFPPLQMQGGASHPPQMGVGPLGMHPPQQSPSYGLHSLQQQNPSFGGPGGGGRGRNPMPGRGRNPGGRGLPAPPPALPATNMTVAQKAKQKQKQPPQPIRSAEEMLISKRDKHRRREQRRFEKKAEQGPEPFTQVLTEAEKAEAARWREERRKNYPTDANIAKKAAEEQARRERGEPDPRAQRREGLRHVLQMQKDLGLDTFAGTSDLFHEVVGFGYGRGRRGGMRGGRGRGRGGRGGFYARRSHGPTWADEDTEKRPADFDIAGDAKRPRPGEGPSPTIGYGKDHDNHGEVSGDDALPPPPRNGANGEQYFGDTKPPPLRNGANGVPCEDGARRLPPQEGNNGDVSQADIRAHPPGNGTDAGEDDAKPPPPRDGTSPALPVGTAAVQCASFKVQSAGGTDPRDEGAAVNGGPPRGRGPSSRRVRGGVRKPRTRRQRTQHQPRREPTLLQKLLAPDIRQEHSHLLQALRFLVNNNFLQDVATKPLEYPPDPPEPPPLEAILGPVPTAKDVEADDSEGEGDAHAHAPHADVDVDDGESDSESDTGESDSEESDADEPDGKSGGANNPLIAEAAADCPNSNAIAASASVAPSDCPGVLAVGNN